jgi:hypothetical protein
MAIDIQLTYLAINVHRLRAMIQPFLSAWLKWRMNRSKQIKTGEKAVVVVTRASCIGL